MLTLEQMAVHFPAAGDAAVVGSFGKVAAARRESRAVVVEGFEDAGEGSEKLVHKFEHMGMQSAFVFSSMAEGGERGLARLGHAVAGLGFMFGPLVGVLATTVAIFGEKLAEVFAKTTKAMEEAVKKAKETAEEMRRATDAEGIHKNQVLLQGDIEESTARLALQEKAYEAAHEKLKELQNEVARGSPIYKRAKNDEIEKYQAMKETEKALEAAKEQQEAYNKAASNIRPARADNKIPPSVSEGGKPATAAETEAIAHDLAIRRAQLENNYGEELRLTVTWVDRMAAEYGRNSEQYRKAEDARVQFAMKSGADLQRLQDEEIKTIQTAWDKRVEGERKAGEAIIKARDETKVALAKSQEEMLAGMLHGLDEQRKKNDALNKQMAEDGKRALAEITAQAQEGAGILGSAISSGFQAAFSGGGISGAFHAFGDQIMAGLASILERQGEAMMAQGAIMMGLLPLLSNPFTSGPALIAAGAALVALGATLSSIATSSTPSGGGGGSSYTSAPASTTGFVTVAPYQSAPSGQATTKGMSGTTPVTVNATIIGKDDPTAQRQIIELIQRAQLRAGG